MVTAKSQREGTEGNKCLREKRGRGLGSEGAGQRRVPGPGHGGRTQVFSEAPWSPPRLFQQSPSLCLS